METTFTSSGIGCRLAATFRRPGGRSRRRFHRDQARPEGTGLRRDGELLQWVSDSGLAVLIADNYAVEAIPTENNATAPVHRRLEAGLETAGRRDRRPGAEQRRDDPAVVVPVVR